MEHLKISNLTITDDEKNQENSDSHRVTTTSSSTNIRIPSTSPRRILQNFRLVWLDGNIEQSENDDSISTTIDQLRQVVNNLTRFTDIDTCIEFIRNIINEKIFLICAEEFGQAIVPLIHENIQMNSIYLFSTNQSQDQDWAKSWYKIKGFYTDYTSVCKALKDAVKVCDHNLVPISFIKKTDDASKQDLNTLDASFMYTQIMKEILLTIEFEPTHITEFLMYCREQFMDGNIQLRKIDQIEQEYYDHSLIWWYTYSYLLYSMVNRALRLMEVDLIIKMGFFLKDLHNDILSLHTIQYDAHHYSDSFVVYRGQGLSQTDFNELQQTQGGLLSFNNFLSTSCDRAVSFSFSESSIESRLDMVGVLFEIIIQPSNSLCSFANIKDISYFKEEEEILFSMHSTFRIGQIKPMENNNRVWQVDLMFTTDTDPQLLSLTERIRQETEGSIGWFRLGQLLLKLALYDKAEDLFMMLLAKTTDKKEQENIHSHLGAIMLNRGQYRSAISVYEQSLQLYEKSLTLEYSDVTGYYNDLGVAYNNIGEYSKALSSHEKALGIYQKTLPENHPDLATSYNNIGLVYYNMGEYSKALSSHEEALGIYQKTLPENHPDLATSYNNIAEIYRCMGEYSKVLSFHEKALEIRQTALPENHPDFAQSYNNIGSVYYSMGEYSKALSYYEMALGICQKTLPENHPGLATSYSNLAGMCNITGEYARSLQYLECAFNIYELLLPSDHPHIKNVQDGIEVVKKKL